MKKENEKYLISHQITDKNDMIFKKMYEAKMKKPMFSLWILHLILDLSEKYS